MLYPTELQGQVTKTNSTTKPQTLKPQSKIANLKSSIPHSVV
jgi:hypothetical protein